MKTSIAKTIPALHTNIPKMVSVAQSLVKGDFILGTRKIVYKKNYKTCRTESICYYLDTS